MNSTYPLATQELQKYSLFHLEPYHQKQMGSEIGYIRFFQISKKRGYIHIFGIEWKTGV